MGGEGDQGTALGEAYDSVNEDIFAPVIFHIFETKLAFTLRLKLMLLGSQQSACYDKSYFRIARFFFQILANAKYVKIYGAQTFVL